MGIISWVIFGLIAGILAKWIMPGKDGGGFFMTNSISLDNVEHEFMEAWVEALDKYGKY